MSVCRAESNPETQTTAHNPSSNRIKHTKEAQHLDHRFVLQQLTKPDGTWANTIAGVFTSFLLHPTFWGEFWKLKHLHVVVMRAWAAVPCGDKEKTRKKTSADAFWKSAFELVCLCSICFHKEINKKEWLTWTEKADTGGLFLTCVCDKAKMSGKQKLRDILRQTSHRLLC